MKCPICGQELRPGKQDPNYLLCYNCKKKFKAPAEKVKKEKVEKVETAEEQPTYSNIPPKKVREKREEEMRKAYDEMLAADDSKKRKKKVQPKKEEIYDDVYDDEDDDEGMSMVPVIILGIAIVAVTAVILYMLLK